MDYSVFLDPLSATAVSVTKKITGLELQPCERISMEPSDVASFSIRSNGGFRISLVLCAQLEILREMARRMKRQTEVTSGDVEIYCGEYFNIICGVFLSHLNNALRTRTRFHIPCFTEGFYPARSVDTDHWYVLPFNCPYGFLEFKIRDLDKKAHDEKKQGVE